MTEKSSDQEVLRVVEELTGNRYVAYDPIFARLGGGAAAGILLSQFRYWSKHTKHDGGWFWKTREEITEETGLSRSEQETARKALVKRGLIDEERRGVPARMWFRVNLHQLARLLLNGNEAKDPPTSWPRSRQLDGRFVANKKATSSPTIHKITQENTNKDYTTYSLRDETENVDNSDQTTRNHQPQRLEELLAKRSDLPRAVGTPSPTPQLDAAVDEVIRRFPDKSPASSRSRGRNLMRKAGVDEATMTQVIYHALAATKDTVTYQGGVKNRMAYFWGTVEKMLESNASGEKSTTADPMLGKWAQYHQR